MKELKCVACGAKEFNIENGRYVCAFCGTSYVLSNDERLQSESSIELNEDIVRVLHQWKEDPENGKKYAQLILQIDPTNEKAKKELARNNTVPQKSGCYIATAVYGSYDCPELWVFRRYRDNYLASKLFGRAFIKTYYVISPTLVGMFGKKKWFNKFWRVKLDRIAEYLKRKGYNDSPYID